MYIKNQSAQAVKRAKANFNSYCKSNCDSIYEFYVKPSKAKISAMNEVRLLAYNNGFNFVRVVHGNSCFFSCGCVKIDKDNGNITQFMYITPNYYTIIDID